LQTQKSSAREGLTLSEDFSPAKSLFEPGIRFFDRKFCRVELSPDLAFHVVALVMVRIAERL